MKYCLGKYDDFENSPENWPTCVEDINCDIPPSAPTNEEYLSEKVGNLIILSFTSGNRIHVCNLFVFYSL